MKKFTKLAAVFAALVLAWACFVACSNGDEDSSSDSGSTSISVEALQGLWLDENAVKNDIDGMYIIGNTMYRVCLEGEKYYYNEEGEKFSISGNQIISQSEEDDDDEIIFFEINGDTLTITSEYKDSKTGEKKRHVSKYNKTNTVPTKLTDEAFMNKFFPEQHQ